MQDRRKQQIGKHGFSFLFCFFGKLPTELIYHAFGYVESAISQIRKKFSTLVDGSTAVVIQQEQETLNAPSVIHVVHNTGWKFCVNPLTGLRIVIHICVVFCDLQYHAYINQLFYDCF